MKVPRDITGRELSKLLEREFGYAITRQRGSHIRLTTEQGGTHHVTVPDHDPLRIGTLGAIVGDVALHFGISRDEAMARLFED